MLFMLRAASTKLHKKQVSKFKVHSSLTSPISERFFHSAFKAFLETSSNTGSPVRWLKVANSTINVPIPAVHVTGVSPGFTPCSKFTVPYGIPVGVWKAETKFGGPSYVLTLSNMWLTFHCAQAKSRTGATAVTAKNERRSRMWSWEGQRGFPKLPTVLGRYCRSLPACPQQQTASLPLFLTAQAG